MSIALITINLCFLLFGLLFLVTYAPFIKYYFKGIFLKKYKKPLKKALYQHKFAILIPARNESNVIEGLLKSILAQNYPNNLFDVFIAVEDKNDKTCIIAKKYNANIYVKKDFTHQGKGYILDELTDYIFKNYDNKNYEAFLVIDADNILKPNFISEMNNAYDLGYEIAVGKRNSKNWNDGWIASCTALTFVKFSRFQNFGKALNNRVVLLAGTGFYISYKIVKEQGWQWHSLTEDNELTIVSALNKYKSTYIDDAVFLDEQPIALSTSIKQRKRWIKGFLDNSKTYSKACKHGMKNDLCDKAICKEYTLGIIPLLSAALSILIPFLGGLVLSYLSYSTSMFKYSIITAFYPLCLFVLVMYLDAFIMISLDKAFINLTTKNKIITILMHPVFSLLYIPIAVSLLFSKVEWSQIEHTVNIEDRSIINEQNELTPT